MSLPPILNVAHSLRSLITREREEVYDELLAEEKARCELRARIKKAAVAAFDELTAELDGNWEQQPNGVVRMQVPDLDLKAKVSFGEDDRPCVVVQLGPVSKPAWIEPDAESIANTIWECVAVLTCDPKWHQSLKTQMRGDARETARATVYDALGNLRDLAALAPVEARGNGRVALPLCA